MKKESFNNDTIFSNYPLRYSADVRKAMLLLRKNGTTEAEG